MRVLVAGATGVIGRQLMPVLAAEGHEVVGLARRAGTDSGARIVSVDALDQAAVLRAVRQAEPEAIVNLLTAIPAEINPKRLADDFALTNRLRTDGTRNLLTAARQVGVGRVVAQGLAYAYDPDGAGPADEQTPLWPAPPAPFVPVLGALKELERNTLAAGGTVLRFGHLYGPGTIYAADGSFTRQVRRRQVPLVGGGTATFSFTHTHDAATAVAASLTAGSAEVLNVVDDEPSPMYEWLPRFATELGAPPPRRAPAFLARWAVGPWGVAFMTKLRGADNARAKRVLGWQPSHPTWRAGFLPAAATAPPAGR
ncbi:NAD(P)-dependent oxidoreductase [Natronosporangium hydrolyticum]|uniref:NAD(P)-dependent oxidoreductase n=1 Tax=Natronosporangium hydrolyticum TaxID=2811111 RepID=A0A895YC47_9ACTN|nr:NAD(P)-dependent oxidoreductase [Natronosporangium hydrolyticum]QSB15357.1 NAD(P)-dependent oxidoreductase [Natronosporangium hydrolyticum]